MVEAMSCARPVVSFDISSAREVLEDQSGGAGTVVHSGDYAGMAEAMIRYCRNSDLAGIAGAKGRAAARRLFEPDQVVERHERVYELLRAKSHD
jgi:glycosyltransferase involved in cell wall biosynthesis